MGVLTAPDNVTTPTSLLRIPPRTPAGVEGLATVAPVNLHRRQQLPQLIRLPRANLPDGDRHGFSGVHTGFVEPSRTAYPRGGTHFCGFEPSRPSCRLLSSGRISFLVCLFEPSISVNNANCATVTARHPSPWVTSTCVFVGKPPFFGGLRLAACLFRIILNHPRIIWPFTLFSTRSGPQPRNLVKKLHTTRCPRSRKPALARSRNCP